jgi:transposase
MNENLEKNRGQRYSITFKRKVIEEIKHEKYSLKEASMRYNILGHSTISKWIKRFDKNELLPNAKKAKMKNEDDKLKKIKKEKEELESALSKAYLKILALESYVEIAEQQLGEDFKKKIKSK